MISSKLLRLPFAGRDPLVETLEKIQNGDTALKDKFISDYKPYVLKTVSSITGRYIDPANNEEFSVGLIAFNEAIENYDREAHKNFLKFSDLVINRRIIDFIRKNKKTKNYIPFTCLETEDGKTFEESYPDKESHDMSYNVEIKEEIFAFTERLASFGVSLSDLAASAPKHSDSRRMCIKVAKQIVNDPILFDKLCRTRTIPLNDLMKVVQVYRGTVERNRKFIIALCLILNSDLDVLKSYVKFAEEGGMKRD